MGAMMRELLSILAVCIAGGACKSHLVFTVERYQVSGTAEGEYARVHPDTENAGRRAQLQKLLVLLPQYRDSLKALNAAGDRLFFPDAAKDDDEQIAKKWEAINHEFEGMTAEVEKELAGIPPGSDEPRRVEVRLLRRYSDAIVALRNANVEFDETDLRRVADQIKATEPARMQERANRIVADFDRLFPAGTSSMGGKVERMAMRVVASCCGATLDRSG